MALAPLFGTVVDHKRKKTALLYSSLLSLSCYLGGAYLLWGMEVATLAWHSPQLWGLIFLLVLGSVAGNLRTIALATTVSLLFAEGRDKMNGLIGTASGLTYAAAAALSGLAVGFVGMEMALLIAIGITFLAILHLVTITLTEAAPKHPAGASKMDIRGSIAAVRETPGLFALILFTTFNNFLGGVFMALMDPYGLSLMSVQAWGMLLASLSVGFMIGGLYIARFGLSPNPVRRLLLVNGIN